MKFMASAAYVAMSIYGERKALPTPFDGDTRQIIEVYGQ